MPLPTRDCPAPSAPPLNPSTVPPQELVRSVSRQPLDRIFWCYSVSWPDFGVEYEKNTCLLIQDINWHLGKNIPVPLLVLHLMRPVTQQPLDRIIRRYSVFWIEFGVECEENTWLPILNVSEQPVTSMYYAYCQCFSFYISPTPRGSLFNSALVLALLYANSDILSVKYC